MSKTNNRPNETDIRIAIQVLTASAKTKREEGKGLSRQAKSRMVALIEADALDHVIEFLKQIATERSGK